MTPLPPKPAPQDPTGRFSLEAPLFALLRKLGAGKSLAERVREARWKRRQPSAETAH